MTLKDKQPWGAGGSSGKRIPDTEDQPVSKALNPSQAKRLATVKGKKFYGPEGVREKQAIYSRINLASMQNRAEMHGLKTGKYGASDGMPRAMRRRGLTYNDAERAMRKKPTTGDAGGVFKSLPASAMAHMIPKSAAPVKTAMSQAKPKGMSLKPMTAMKPMGVSKVARIRLEKLPKGAKGHFSGRKYGTRHRDDLVDDLWTSVFRGPRRTDGGNVKIIRKAARYHDPDAQRQRRLGAAEGITGAGGLALAYSDIKGKRSTIERGEARDVNVGRKGKTTGMLRSQKWGTVRPIKSVSFTPRLAGAGALLGAAYGIDRYANSPAGRRYR